MMYEVRTTGENKLSLAELCQQHADELWVPAHLDAEQQAEFVLDHFKRAILAELEMLEIACTE